MTIQDIKRAGFNLLCETRGFDPGEWEIIDEKARPSELDVVKAFNKSYLIIDTDEFSRFLLPVYSVKIPRYVLIVKKDPVTED